MPHNKIDAEKIDWTMQDCVIAKQFDVSRERVRQIRNVLGKPKSPNHRRCNEVRCNELKKKREEKWEKISAIIKDNPYPCAREISRITGIEYQMVRKCFREHAVEVRRFGWVEGRKYDIKKWNWDLPTSILQKIYNVSEAGYVCILRKKYGHPPKFKATTVEGKKMAIKVLKKYEKKKPGRIDPNDYYVEDGHKYITYELIKKYHNSKERENFTKFMRGQTCTVLKDNKAGIYPEDYERWLREGKKCEQGKNWD